MTRIRFEGFGAGKFGGPSQLAKSTPRNAVRHCHGDGVAGKLFSHPGRLPAVLPTGSVAVGLGRRQRVWSCREQGLDRGGRVRLGGLEYRDAAGGHLVEKAGAAALGNQDIEPVEGVRPVTGKFVHRHILGEIDALQRRHTAVGDGIDEKTAGLAGMAGDGAEILTGNPDDHWLPFALSENTPPLTRNGVRPQQNSQSPVSRFGTAALAKSGLQTHISRSEAIRRCLSAMPLIDTDIGARDDP